MLGFEERGKPECPEKTSRSSEGENQQQTQPSYGINTGIWARSTILGSECSNHCTTLKPLSANTEKEIKTLAKHIGNNLTGRNIKCVGHKIKEWLTLKIAVVRPFSNFSYGEENFEWGRYSSHTNVTRFHAFGHNFDPVSLTTPKCDILETREKLGRVAFRTDFWDCY